MEWAREYARAEFLQLQKNIDVVADTESTIGAWFTADSDDGYGPGNNRIVG